MTRQPTVRVRLLAAACGFAVFSLPSLPGCATSAPKETAQERQDRALKDPFGYKPDWKNTSVGGGGTADLDKDGLGKDLHNVFIR